MVGNKRGKEEKKKKRVWVRGWRRKKEGGKKKGRRAHVCGEKKKIISQYFHNIFTINFKVGYY